MCRLREIPPPAVDFARAARLRLTIAVRLIQSYAKLRRATASPAFASTVMAMRRASNHELQAAYQIEKFTEMSSGRRHEMFIARSRANVFMGPFMGQKNIPLLRSSGFSSGEWFYKHFAAPRRKPEVEPCSTETSIA